MLDSPVGWSVKVIHSVNRTRYRTALIGTNHPGQIFQHGFDRSREHDVDLQEKLHAASPPQSQLLSLADDYKIRMKN